MDFIPLETPSSALKKRIRIRNKRNKVKAIGNPKPAESHVSSVDRGFKNSRPNYTGCDAKLIPRIRQYMQTCDVSKGLRIDGVVDHLQQSYLEYKRKKKSSFRTAVLKGIDFVRANSKNSKSDECETELLEVESGSSSVASVLGSDFSVDNDSYVLYEDTNSANNALRDMYARKIQNDNEVDHAELASTASASVPKMNHVGLVKDGPSVDINSSAKKNDTVGDNLKNKNVTNKKKSKSREILPQQSSVTFEAIGGIEECIEEVCKLLVHLKHPEVYSQLGVTPPRGLLLHGPPGCGKTLLANAIAGELELPFFKMAATELVSGVSGESEEKIRELFDTAVASAPCVLFLDEVDAITPKRDTVQREMERRIVSQLLTCMDDLNSKDMSVQVLVIGATNRPDALDPALRRAGRFDREISMGIPNTEARMRILKVLCRNLRLSSTVDLMELAKESPGYVGADLMALTREAAMCAVDRVFQSLESEIISKNINEGELVPVVDNKESSVAGRKDYLLTWLREQPPLTAEQMKDLFVEMVDFKAALKLVQPSAKREGFATVPDVTWADIGALREVREELQLSIMGPIRHRDKFELLGLSNPAGILLCGPPGCGKTLLAKAIANESGVNFISVKGPELLNMYLGESERAVRQCFQRAQNSSPCVIFFDELDALCPRRSDSAESGASSRVVNQLLTEMDGINGRKDVFILGATNRPDILDPAVLRPGRLDKILFVNLPSPEERFDILNTITKGGTKPCMSPEVSLKAVALDRRCNGFTGADLAALIREASVVALKEFIICDSSLAKNDPIVVKQIHFEKAFERVRLSISPRDQRRYEAMRLTYSSMCNSAVNQKTPVPMDIAEQSSIDCMDIIIDNATEIG